MVGFLYIVSGTLIATLRTHIKAAYYLGLAWMGAGFTIAVILNRPRRTLPTWYVFTSDVFLALSATLGVALWLHSLKYFPRERPGLAARRWAIRGALRPGPRARRWRRSALTWTAPVQRRRPVLPGARWSMLIYASLVSIRTRRTYSAEDRQISRPTSAMTGIAVGFTIAIGVVGVLGRGVTCPGSLPPSSRASAPCCSSRCWSCTCS